MSLHDHLEQQSNLGLCLGLHPKHAEMIIRCREEDRWVEAVTTLSQLDNIVAWGGNWTGPSFGRWTPETGSAPPETAVRDDPV